MNSMRPAPGIPSSIADLPRREEQRSFDGTRLVVWHWPSEGEKVRGSLFICHGLGEHGRRYDHVAAAAAERGWDVWYWDHRGHGLSEGTRGHVLRFRDYVEDLKILRSTRVPDGQTAVLLGHSMGGLIAALYLLTYPGDFKRAVLSAPALGINTKVPVLKALAGRVLSRLAPSLTLANEIDSRLICSDAEIVQKYVEDPLVHDRVSARWFTEFLETIETVQAKAAELSVPTSIWCGAEDGIASPASCAVFRNKAQVEGAYYPLPGLYHEILNEKGWRQLTGDMLNWLEQ